ncbi:uncharacterized protein [Chironomus tepperi]|uniref:uncharacterized protein n=1 Tax=Chironomus tepperi TaxID=113505 RepID=UPI00391FC86B
MSLNIREINPTLQKIARDELNEDPSQIPQMLEQFREWIRKSPHLRARTDDQFLVSFLRGSKYSLERAKQKLDMFYTVREHSPEFFKDRDPAKMNVREYMQINAMFALPTSWSEGAPRVIFSRSGGYDPSKYKLEDIMKCFTLIGDLLHEEDDQMIISGQINVVDLKHASIAHFTAFTPQMMKKMTVMMQDASPFRLKAIHYINVPSFFEKMFAVFKQFLNEKTKSRIHIHGSDLESLYKFIPKHILPKEYGGDGDTVDNIMKYWEDKIYANRQLLVDQTTKYGVDEKKRIGRPKNPESLFGIDGTFRQLQIVIKKCFQLIFNQVLCQKGCKMVQIRPLNQELQKKAIDELFEDPNRIEKDLEAFREWIKKSPHIKGRTDDQFLIAFLRGCKYSIEKAKQKYDTYYTLKTHVPELCRDRDPMNPKVLGAIRQGVGLFLPKSDKPDGPRYFLIRPGAYNPSEYSIQEIMKVSTMLMDAMMMEDDSFIVAGQVGILDFTGVSLNHFVQFNPTFIKKMTMLQQDAAPVRNKASHFVKMPQFALAVFNIFQSFTNEKNKKRTYVYGDNFEELYKVVPKHLLPEEYGGEAGSIPSLIEASEKLLMSYRDFFLEDEKYGVDEKKRVGRPKNPESLFGVDGTFRKLDID